MASAAADTKPAIDSLVTPDAEVKDVKDVKDAKDVKDVTEVKEVVKQEAQNGVAEDEAASQNAADSAPKSEFTVFVGKLSPRLNTEDLKAHFKSCGEVVSVNLPWKVVKKSKRLGIAFVDFVNKEGYEAALKLNHTPLDGQQILVLPATRTHEGLLMMDAPEEPAPAPAPPSAAPAADGAAPAAADKLARDPNYVPVYRKSDFVAFVKNLPAGQTEDEILAFFNLKREDVIDIGIPFKPKRPNKKPLKAIIAFPTAEGLEAILAQSKRMFKDREVLVERHLLAPRGEKRPADGEAGAGDASPEKQARNWVQGGSDMELDLFVKHIPHDVGDRELKEFFSSAGAKVMAIKLFPGNQTGTSRGMGFVTMADRISVERGLALDRKRFYKTKIRVSVRKDREHLDQPDKEPAALTHSLFVSGLPRQEKVGNLKQALAQHFRTHEVRVRRMHVPRASGKGSVHRGYALVVFEDDASHTKALTLNDSELKGVAGGKAVLTLSDRWPEAPLGPPMGPPGPLMMGPPMGPPGGFADPKRRRKGPMGGGGPHPHGWGPGGPPGPHGPHFGRPEPVDFGGDYGGGGDGGAYNPDYQDYLDYLEYKEYMAFRAAHQERREFAEFRARFRGGGGGGDEVVEDFRQKPVPPPAPKVAPLPPARSWDERSAGPGYTRRASPGKEEEFTRRYERYGDRGDGDYDDAPQRSRASSMSDYRSGGGGGYGGSAGYRSGGGGGGGDAPYSRGRSPEPPRGSASGYDSFSGSLNSSRYQTADSSAAMGRSRGTLDSTMGSGSGAYSAYGDEYSGGGGAGGGSSAMDTGRSQYSLVSYPALDRGGGYAGAREAAAAAAAAAGGGGGGGGGGSGYGSAQADASARYTYQTAVAAAAALQAERDRQRYSGYGSAGKGALLDKADRMGGGGTYDGYSSVGYRTG